MNINTKFVHKNFFLKQFDKQNINKVQTAPIYSSLVINKTYFIVAAQKINLSVQSAIKPKASFFFKIKVPSKTIFNLILLESFNLVKCLKFMGACSFSSFSKRQTNYTVLRAPFVFKNSREQLCLDRYVGSFYATFSVNNFLIVDFIEACFFKILISFFRFDIKGVKKLA